MGEGKGEGTQDVTKESIIEQTYCSENLPQPLFAKSRQTRDSLYKREGRRDLVSSIYTILD